jgi:GDP-mannose 6-dehydrogenase
VGTVSAGCLANEWTSSTTAALRLFEAKIGEIIAANVQSGRLRAVVDAGEAIQATNLSLVCVGSPNQPNGNLDLRFIRRICEQIGDALGLKYSKHTVVVCRTVLPGTMVAEAVLDFAQTIVIGRKDPDFQNVLEMVHDGQSIVDLVRITDRRSNNGKYDGICW